MSFTATYEYSSEVSRTATLVRMMPYQPKRVLYLTSKPGKPASEDYYGLIKDNKIPIEPAQSIDELAKEVDMLFVCCALTPSTKNMVDAEFLSKMKVQYTSFCIFVPCD